VRQRKAKKMAQNILQQMTVAVENLSATHNVGRVLGVHGGTIQVGGVGDSATVGDRARVYSDVREISGEVVRLEKNGTHVLIDGALDGVCLGNRVVFEKSPLFAPDDSWVGRVIDPDGCPIDGRSLLPGVTPRRLRAEPPAPHQRRPMGKRLETGIAAFNTLLPIVQGQRVGLFAGSGVGKSTLIADLARGVNADVIVIALVGERGREVRHFVDTVLGPEGMKRAVVVAATSERAAHVRRRCAWAATAVAEHFRDAGKQVLLMIDSVTRFCEAHREVAVAAGEATNLRGFPASTGPAIAALCERAGPGMGDAGDITAVFSVLVAGSDMDEPVADMLRGVLDGHVILRRDIAERGRFPAIDVLCSVSRSLPDAASDQENALISQARAHLGAFARSELMIQSGLYTSGSDPKLDVAIACAPGLDTFLTIKDQRGTLAHFAKLRQALSSNASRMTPDDIAQKP
jgi:flagellum-specific ATP synthase